ncbi:MAG: YifB family Mg chelatase-like AAA ATPase [Eubacterium sp.]|nr:YifB family Mg chelatase-like AAA ATPase [Eubacterium sp.]
MFAKVKSQSVSGLSGFDIVVEADVSSGLPRFDLVGLPDAAVRESRERVRATVKNCGLTFPVSRITVNIAPADVKKEGAFYDLPIFIAIMKASGQLRADTDGCSFIGELSLDGEIRPANGVLPMVIQARDSGIGAIFVPSENAAEGSVVEGIDVLPASKVGEILAHLSGDKLIEPVKKELDESEVISDELDFCDVKGQHEAKRALEIAAAGGHNCLMIGTPGTGKSMLAKRIGSILPEMSFDEKIETTKIYSVAGALPKGARLIAKRPFRSPHHTISPQGMTGGGINPRPGEISLAHNGVLFLDEFPEFDRRAKESLRQPLEDGTVTITRTSGTVTYPSNIMLIAAMNPCPCGYLGHPTRKCSCTDAAKKRYSEKTSGPLLDRIDIHIEVQNIDYEQLSGRQKEETSAEIRERVNKARSVQLERFKGTGITCNAKMTPRATRQFCVLSAEADALLKQSFDSLGLSPRAYDKILRVSRTIADLEGSELIELSHVAEAIQYRSLDRKYWR